MSTDLMLDTSSVAVSELIAHGHINPGAQCELRLEINRVLLSAPTGITTPQKQLVLLSILEELCKCYPVEYQPKNLLALIMSMTLGVGLLTAINTRPVNKDSML